MPRQSSHPAKVWILQQQIAHYRIPVWDALAAISGDSIELKVLGRLDQGRPFGSESAPSYIHDLDAHHTKPNGHPWDGIEQLLETHRPDVLISETNPRLRWCWRLPRVCKRLGIVPIAWTKVKSNYSKLPGPLMRLVKKRLFKRYALYLVYGNESRDELVSLGFPPEKVFVANNTIDTRRIFEQGDQIRDRALALRRQRKLEDKKILLAISRMDPAKRIGDLLDAWPKLREIDKDLVLALVGGGTLLEDIKRTSREIDPKRIIVTGRVPEGEDYTWIAAADINIQPGAVGLAINQSMALGTATAIADEKGPDTEILAHGETGWRYPKGDLDAMARLVKQLLTDHDTVRKVTGNARVLMRDKITVENMAGVMHTAINEALQLRQAEEGTA